MGAMYRTNPTSFTQTRPALCGQFDGYPPPTSIGEKIIWCNWSTDKNKLQFINYGYQHCGSTLAHKDLTYYRYIVKDMYILKG